MEPNNITTHPVTIEVAEAIIAEVESELVDIGKQSDAQAFEVLVGLLGAVVEVEFGAVFEFGGRGGR
jgi:hypothetical protein